MARLPVQNGKHKYQYGGQPFAPAAQIARQQRMLKGNVSQQDTEDGTGHEADDAHDRLPAEHADQQKQDADHQRCAAGARAQPIVRRQSAATGCAGVYLFVAVFAPQVLSAIDAQAAPWHRYSIFLITIGLWVFAAWRLWRTARITRNRVDGALAFVAFWLAQATVSLHLFPFLAARRLRCKLGRMPRPNR